MKVQQFLEHHGIARNPFAEEDAQTDPVFKEACIDTTYHPAWDKVFGDPREPATSLVFGQKGAGKTAMRLQIARHVAAFNQENPGQRLYLVHYDDFNPFLDRFRERLPKRKRRPDRVLAQWRLWDHMDSILTLAVTGLADRILAGKPTRQSADAPLDRKAIGQLDRFQCRDLLLLAACYDQATSETFASRWNRLRRKLGFDVWRSSLDFWGAVLWTIFAVAVGGYYLTQYRQWGASLYADLFASTAFALLLGAGWLPRFWRWWQAHTLARQVHRHQRVGNRDVQTIRQILLRFTKAELAGQPLPCKDSTDDRYEMLNKLQRILETLGFAGMLVLVDRIDEPHLINGSAEHMKALIWPMLDNKFLKHPGLGLKLMLPSELVPYIDREENSFYQRSRLDKQNVVHSFEWTGQALYDVANARITACAENEQHSEFSQLFDQTVSESHLLESLRSLKVPRNLFKFLYRLLVTHCNNHTDTAPVWEIPLATFESTLALYHRDQEAFERGLGSG